MKPSMKDNALTLTQFILEQSVNNQPDYDFSALMSHIALVAKVIAVQLRRAGLVDILGHTGTLNIQGEVVKKLDEFANTAFIQAFENSGLVCLLASEEMEKPLQLQGRAPGGRYVLLFDPLDGSSNIEVNGTLGTIFSIRLARDPMRPDPSADILRKGTDQFASGYVVYGPSTLLIFSVGRGVHGFTLDPDLGEFILSHPEIRIPKRGKTYSANHGNYRDWVPEAKQYVDYLLEKDPSEGRPYSLRYVGTLVADLHRTLLEGGVFLYPASKKSPEGKLRLLYEVAPMAFLVEAAGGKATRGIDRILDIVPSSLHQRVPLVIGSAEDVDKAMDFFSGSQKV